MKKLFMYVLLLSLISIGAAIDKSAYDLETTQSLLKGNSIATVEGFGSQIIGGTASELTMLSGGYFTIGTKNGMSTSRLDDNCGITFGHPFALTSYPVISVDGNLQKFEDYFGRTPSMHSNDTLFVLGEGTIKASFAIVAQNGGQNYEIHLSLENNDVVQHSLGLGFMFDPALGQWGDGSAYVGSDLVEINRTLQDEQIPDILKIWERGYSADSDAYSLGMGAYFDFTEKPDQITFHNWLDTLNPDVEKTSQILYDLVVEITWGEWVLQPGASKSWKTSLNLDNPDFAAPVFLRWDSPAFLSMENNQLFPRDFGTTVQAAVSMNAPGDYRLIVEPPYEMTVQMSDAPFNFSSENTNWQSVKLSPIEIYEDKVVPMKIKCVNSAGTVVDEIKKNIFIPATPVSDAGLKVEFDSVYVDEYPKLGAVFGVENEITGTRVLDLRKENVFLYENGIRINEYEFGKDVATGALLADVVFVLDISGSMGDEINAVRNNINEFGETLAAEGYDYQIGVVTFSTTVTHIWDLTTDLEQIKTNLANISLWGGTEDSPAALYKGSELTFRDGSKRSIIWVTDEPYPEHSFTQEDIVNRMLLMDITVHGVGLTDLQTDWFNPIVLPTGGNFYNINGNFRDIMLDVARVKSADRYRVTFDSPIEANVERTLLVKIHYAGLGGSAETSYTPPTTTAPPLLKCFPNPFNPTVTIAIDLEEAQKGEVTIHNVLGQKIRTFPLNSHSQTQLLWNATDQFGLPVSSGVYYVSLVLNNPSGTMSRNVEKIMYLK